MSDPDAFEGVTPVDKLFTYHIFGTPRYLEVWRRDPATYRLSVGGLVERPGPVSLSDLKSNFEPVLAEMVIQCVTNVHWGRLSMRGARLLDVLESAGIREEAWKLAFHAADGYTTGLRLDEVRERPNSFLLAYEMNGEPMPPDHGFPVRLASDGKYGFKWPKWLVGIEAADYDFKGHYEGKRGWSDEGARGRPVT